MGVQRAMGREKGAVFEGRDMGTVVFPDAEVHEFTDCGHYVLEDASAEIIDLVRRFTAVGVDGG